MQKKVAILFGVGCGGVIFLMIAGGIAAVLLAPKMFEWGQQQVALEQDRKEIADAWQPPAEDASLETFFPAGVANYELDSQGEDATIPDFGFDLDGRRATYRSNDSRIDVFVYRATELEKEALFRRVSDVYEEQEGGFKRITETGSRLYYSSAQHHQNHFWWMEGWLLVFRTDDSEDQEPFVRKFLQASSAKKIESTFGGRNQGSAADSVAEDELAENATEQIRPAQMAEAKEGGRETVATNSEHRQVTRNAPIGSERNRDQQDPGPPPPVVPREDGTITINIDEDFAYVPDGWPFRLSQGQTSVTGLNPEPFETLSAEPEYKADQISYGYVSLGNSDDPKLSFAVTVTPDDEYSVYFDANNNENLTDDGPPQVNQGSGRFAAAIALDVEVLSGSGEKRYRPYRLWLWLPKSGSPRMYSRCHHRGRIVIDGKTYNAVAYERRNHDALYSRAIACRGFDFGLIFA